MNQKKEKKEKNVCSFIEALHSDPLARNGAFLFETINTLEKREVLKGLNTQNATGIKSNFLKIFSYLKSKEKFNRRFLLHRAEYYFIEGNFDFFWGFLADLMYFYKGQTSIFDSSQRRQKSAKAKSSANFFSNNERQHVRKIDESLNRIQ